MHRPTWFALVLIVLAVYRLSRLVTRDIILNRPRNWLVDNFEGWVVTLMLCPWCISVWIAPPVIVLTIYCWPWWSWVMVGLAASAVAGQLSEHE